MKHYYHAVPVHLLVTDISGDSFIWERSPLGNTEIIIPNNSAPQIITNFLLHQHDLNNALPVNPKDPDCEFLRYTKLKNSLEEKTVFSEDEIEEINSRVYFKPSANKDGMFSDSGRTLLHSLYFPKDKKVKIKFYSGDAGDNNILFSELLGFKLK